MADKKDINDYENKKLARITSREEFDYKVYRIVVIFIVALVILVVGSCCVWCIKTFL